MCKKVANTSKGRSFIETVWGRQTEDAIFSCASPEPRGRCALIRDNDPAAAIALGLSLLGFVLPVVSAIAHSANVVDCLIWSAIALIVQVVVYFVVKIPVPNLSAKIAAGELAPAIWLGLASLAAGALNAASMIY